LHLPAFATKIDGAAVIRCQKGLCGNVATRVCGYVQEGRLIMVRPVCDRCAPDSPVFWPIPAALHATVDEPVWPEEPEES
jgi:hypothetical protein